VAEPQFGEGDLVDEEAGVVAGVPGVLAGQERGEGLAGVVAAEELVDRGEHAGQVGCLRAGQDEAVPALPVPDPVADARDAGVTLNGASQRLVYRVSAWTCWARVLAVARRSVIARCSRPWISAAG
jgi:hypothetical protein